jgi:hypothetical protein
MSFLASAARSLAALVGLAVVLAAGPARAESTRVSFILVNDIYQMSDRAGPDGKRRGGFARLATIVKAERAKGGHVIFAHAGDTLMSGIDHGANIMTLTNMVKPDFSCRAIMNSISARPPFSSAWRRRNSRSTPPICAAPTDKSCRISRIATS